MRRKEQLAALWLMLRGTGRYALFQLSELQSLSRLASHDASLSGVSRDIVMAKNKVMMLKGKPSTLKRRAAIRALNSLAQKLERRRPKLLCLRLARR
jgi:hypothetical protein